MNSALRTLRVFTLILLAGCQKPEGLEKRGESGKVILVERPRVQPAVGDSAMVVSASPFATRVGLNVLRAGGNAVDAAVAVAMTLAVTYPAAGNIGGGGFMVARVNGANLALDFRETAPKLASRDMYLDASGHVTDRSLTGALASGVPGSVAGLFEAHRKYGVKPWAELVQPAIELAKTGFAIDSAFAAITSSRCHRCRQVVLRSD